VRTTAHSDAQGRVIASLCAVVLTGGRRLEDLVLSVRRTADGIGRAL
jgi:hypothetical protein